VIVRDLHPEDHSSREVVIKGVWYTWL
jgi:hypothetical protein